MSKSDKLNCILKWCVLWRMSALLHDSGFSMIQDQTDFYFWHKRSAYQSVCIQAVDWHEDSGPLLARACGVPAIGVRAVDCWQWRSGHYFHNSFFFPFIHFPPPFFFSPPLRPFLIEGVLGSKNLFSKSCLERPKPKDKHLSAILGPPGGHFGFLRFS